MSTDPVQTYLDEISESFVEKDLSRYVDCFHGSYLPILENFIKKNDAIIVNEMMIKLVDESFPLPKERYRYEVFTGQNGIDLIKGLADEFYKITPYVEVHQLDRYLYELKVDFNQVLKLTRLSDFVFNKIPTFKVEGHSKQQLRCLDANLYRIKLYRIFTNPRQDIDKWIDSYQIMHYLDLHFPIEKVDYTCEKHEFSPLIREILVKQVVDKEPILIGDIAHLILAQKAGQPGPQVEYLELLTNNPKSLANKIKKMGKNLRYDKRTSNLYLYKEKYVIRDGKKTIAVLYDVSEECVPYNQYTNKNEKEVKVGNFHVLMRFHYIRLWDSGEDLCKIIQLKNIYHSLLNRLDHTGLEDGLDRVFNIECQGTEVNKWRENRIARIKMRDKPASERWFMLHYHPIKKFKEDLPNSSTKSSNVNEEEEDDNQDIPNEVIEEEEEYPDIPNEVIEEEEEYPDMPNEVNEEYPDMPNEEEEEYPEEEDNEDY